jgi:hypothetical protein
MKLLGFQRIESLMEPSNSFCSFSKQFMYILLSPLSQMKPCKQHVILQLNRTKLVVAGLLCVVYVALGAFIYLLFLKSEMCGMMTLNQAYNSALVGTAIIMSILIVLSGLIYSFIRAIRTWRAKDE